MIISDCQRQHFRLDFQSNFVSYTISPNYSFVHRFLQPGFSLTSLVFHLWTGDHRALIGAGGFPMLQTLLHCCYQDLNELSRQAHLVLLVALEQGFGSSHILG